MTLKMADVDFGYATSIAEMAMRCMSEQQVAPTPEHFRLWYIYCQDTNPGLKRAIDVLISNRKTFDSQTMRDLISVYIDGVTAPDNYETSQKLSEVMSEARKYLSTAASDNQAHMREIKSIAAKGEAGQEPLELIKNLMSELAKAAARATALEKNFSTASTELDSIRTSLTKAEEQSKTDTLTGLPNRRALEEFFRKAQIDAMEHGQALSALLIDIDHFKRFNDTYGHSVGDQVLRLVAHALDEQVRHEDLAARYGGEELIAVLPGADIATCFATAERIRSAIAKCRIKRRSSGEELSGVTVSIGVGQFRLGESMTELIDRCDEALYLAKKTGRNRTVREDELEVKQASCP
jgi:diguanylate cyclase